jgi:uroporphyrinogen-III synthase
VAENGIKLMNQYASNMHHVLVIRPLEDALPMARLLESEGIEVSHYPLFKLHSLPIPALSNPQALIVTSKNAIRALTKYNDLKKIPLYAVGDKTAELATQSGFLNVLTASGTSQDLIQLIVKIEQRNKGILWHLSGEMVKGNIVESLTNAGFEAKRQIVYRIEDATNLPASLHMKLKNHSLSHVLFCSSRTTSVFINLLKKKKLEKSTCQMIALCLSEDIKEKILGLKWKKLWVSPYPNVNDLMGYFDEKR